jgi:hypothetical protein
MMCVYKNNNHRKARTLRQSTNRPALIARHRENDRANHYRAPVRRETNDERLSRRYGNGIVFVGNYDGMHIGPPTNFIKEPLNR